MSKAVNLVFDLDGTISDPIEGIQRSMNFALQTYGFDQVSKAEIGKLIGPPLDEGFKCLVPSADASLIQNLIEKYRERYADVGYTENTLYDGMKSVLEQLRSQKILMGVCTSKRVDFAENILNYFAIREWFDFVDGGDVGRSKRQQLRDLNYHGQVDGNSVMIGDRAVDMEAADKNGMPAIGVLWGYGSETELLEAGASKLCSKAVDLIALSDAA